MEIIVTQTISNHTHPYPPIIFYPPQIILSDYSDIPLIEGPKGPGRMRLVCFYITWSD